MRKLFCLCLLGSTLLILSCGGAAPPPGGSGFIETTEILVSAQAQGQLRLLRFDEGDPIAEGDTIGEIDTVTAMLRLRHAESAKSVIQEKITASSLAIEQASYNSDLAQKEYDRVAALLEVGSIDQQRYDQVKNAYHQAVLSQKQAQAAYQAALAELDRAESDIALLKKQLSDCFPTSPASGTLTTKFVDPGELVSMGKPLVKVAQLDTVWVKIYLPPADLTKIKLGGRALVDPEDGHTEPLHGWVSWISDEAEFTPKNVQTKEARADLVYAVKVTIPNPHEVLKIGMPVSVRIP
jgi:HlyD family secretion protein